MTDPTGVPHRIPASASAPARAGGLLPRRDLALAWVLMALLAALAWAVTLAQSRGAGMEHGPTGVALPLFLLLWVVMMAAMMLPSIAPVAITWARAIGRQSAGAVRAGRIAQFAGGYLVAWATFGLIMYVLLAAAGEVVDGHGQAGRWIGAAAFLLAGLYQFGPLKSVCLRHCRSPMSHLLRYAQFRPWLRDLRVGVHHGCYCVGCCAALMIVFIPLGVMNVAAMAALAAVIFLEKLWRRGPMLSRAVGVAFLVLAALAPFQDWLLPGLQPAGETM
jgi:predicted metal-binding membrane protein